MNHYFENNEQLDHRNVSLELLLNNIKLTLSSDRGVFSAKEIDEGSLVLLKAIIQNPVEGEVLDVGCGYGILGLYLAKANPHINVTMFDVNARAVALTNTNIVNNQITNAHVYVAGNYQALHKQTMNLIVINPPIRAGKKVYYPLLSEAKNYLTDGGKLMFVIRKSHGALSAYKYCLEFYSKVELIDRDKGFHVYCAYK